MEELKILTKQEATEINGGVFGVDDAIIIGLVFLVGVAGGFLWEYFK